MPELKAYSLLTDDVLELGPLDITADEVLELGDYMATNRPGLIVFADEPTVRLQKWSPADE